MRTTFAACFAQVGQQAPLVHCISNLVSANDCANIVLAAGASPIMADDPEEAAEITAQSKGLCLSLGTPSPRKAQAMFRAGCEANARQLPVVFDPVGVGASAFRQGIAKELLEQVSFVFQDSKLLKMSIYDNVRMGKKDASREEVMEALKNAQCEDIIEKLPDGMDTIIGTKGTYVSGGEAQRLSIARAMLKNAPILILDEATAFADPDNETKVQEAFSRLSKGKTVVMIAHRLSSVTNADRIFVLKDGEIEESGTHESLEKANGLYAHMWEKYNQSVCWKVGV